MPTRKIKLERIFHALGDPTRRAIVERLSHGPATVSRLAIPLGVTLAAVVQQLQLLEESGLVQTEKIGRVRTCRLDLEGLTFASQWIQSCRAAWERRLERLGDLLSEEASN